MKLFDFYPDAPVAALLSVLAAALMYVIPRVLRKKK